MVIVYTYRDDGNDGMELKYSIRSMVKHFKSLTDIILVSNPGQVPTWYKGRVREFEDFKGKPALSIMAKMIAADVEDFLWCADDHFAIKDFDDTLPNYYNKHARRIVSMKGMQENCSPGWLNCIVHTPIVINREKMLEACNWANGREFPIKTLYVNFHSLPGTVLTDLKFRGDQSYENIKAQLIKRPFFSTHENAMKYPGMRKIMDELYPEKTIFEG